MHPFLGTTKGCASTQPGGKTNRQTWNPGNWRSNIDVKEGPG